ncbi:hypothetical protein [Polaribacter sp. Z022]|uniref:hypothetical protein n=1 Tax=Polaribacter sp. Z022 TaxID=2927125 RepID=UPI002021EF72|nr:hypothetical protein [Polaribacter sp. Z022]MCL7755020.1 hypothetical protein [Polaribacter sp. Z022]
MSKETRKVNVIYEELRDRATYPLLLYIPKAYYKHLLEEEELLKIDWLFDVLILAKKEMDIVFIDDKDESQEVLKKQSILGENLFDLIDYQIALNPTQFSFLINKYKDHVFVMQYVTELMMNDVNSGNNEIFKKYLGLFILQESALAIHKTNIDNAFPSFRKTQEEEDYMRENVIDNFKIPIVEQEEVVTPKQKSKRKKEKIITDLESQNFLLESVFKIKIQK